MADIFSESMQRLQKLAAKYPEVLVAYSGGKDSLVVTDLCCKAFQRVTAVHMEFVPGLKVVEDQIELAKSRWGIDVIRVPDNVFLRCYQIGEYNDVHHSIKKIKTLRNNDVFKVVAHEGNFSLVANGMKRGDGMFTMAAGSEENVAGELSQGIKMVCPLWKWRNTDVLAYLTVNKIPIPPSDGRKSSSIDMTEPNILWLWDKQREDFYLLEKYFPYMRAVVKRREWYGKEAQ